MSWDEGELLPETTVAWAWKEAEQRKADDEARRLAAAELLDAQLVELRVYDPLGLPDDLRMYEGTGIGALYGLPGSERFLDDLGDWRVVPRRAT